MSRRDPFRRSSPLRRSPPTRLELPPKARRALDRANGLMADGEFASAAHIFGRLCEEANQHSGPVLAADLALRASRAYFAADDVEAAVGRARQALRLFARARQVGRVSHALSRVLQALRERGYNAQADQLEQDTARALEEMGLSLDESSK